MEMKRAGDIMIPLESYPHIPYWFSLRQAVAVMRKSEIDFGGRKSPPRVALVFNEHYELLGMLQRRDILRGLEPQFLAGKPLQHRAKLFEVAVDPNLGELSYDKLIKGMREQAGRPVSDVMIPVRATVDFGDHLMKVIYEMVVYDLSVVPVLKDGNVAGVVRSIEVFNEAARLIID